MGRERDSNRHRLHQWRHLRVVLALTLLAVSLSLALSHLGNGIESLRLMGVPVSASASWSIFLPIVHVDSTGGQQTVKPTPTGTGSPTISLTVTPTPSSIITPTPSISPS